MSGSLSDLLCVCLFSPIASHLFCHSPACCCLPCVPCFFLCHPQYTSRVHAFGAQLQRIKPMVNWPTQLMVINSNLLATYKPCSCRPWFSVIRAGRLRHQFVSYLLLIPLSPKTTPPVSGNGTPHRWSAGSLILNCEHIQ